MAISLARYVVTIHPDFTRLRAEITAEAARLSRTGFSVRPDLNLASFRAQWGIFAARYLSDQTITIRPVLAPGGLSSSAFRARDLAIKVRLDLTAFRAQWRLFAATYLNHVHTISVHPIISRTAAQGVVDAFGRDGDRAGRSFGGGFSMRWKLIAGAIISALPLLQPLVGILGSVVQAAGAVGAALPLALASVGVLVATLGLSFHNLGDAIKGAFSGDPTKGEREAFEKLAPAAKQFVGVLLDARTRLSGFQTEIQQQFFLPFLDGFKALVASPAINQLRVELGLIAADAGAAGGAIARAFADSAKSGQFATILGGIRGSFDQLLGLAGPLTKMFLTLAQFAQPFVDILVNKLVVGLFQLTDLVSDSAADGSLAKFFNDGATAIQQLVALVQNVGSIIHSIFSGVVGDSNTFLESLSVLTGQFATFLKSADGQAILGLLADKLALIGRVITQVLGPVMPLIIQLAQTISGALNGAIERILPFVTRFLILLVSGLQPILTALTPVFELLVDVVTDFIEQGLRELITHMGKVIPTVVQLAQELGPKLIPLVIAFGEALMALIPIIPTLSEFIVALLPLLVDLIPVFNALIQVLIFFAHGSELVIGVVIAVIGWFLEWSKGTQALFAVLKAVAAGIVVAWDAVVSWFQTKIIPSFRNAINDVKSFFTGLGNLIQSVHDRLQSIWNTSINWFRTNFVAPIQDLVGNKIPAAFRSGVDLIEFWWNRLKAVARAPVEFFINTVVNKGIVGTFNAVAKWVPGLGTVNEIHPAGFAAGGEFSGEVFGPPSTRDNRVARGPNGEAIGLATGEMVVNSRQTAKHRGLLHAINAGMAGYADGGLIGAITNPAGWVKDRIGDMLGRIPGGGQLVKVLAGLGTKMVAGLIEFVKSKLSFGGDGGPFGPGPGFGAWPSSPGAQRGDSGVWRSIVALINSTGPLSGSFGNAYRPGDPLWHGSGRAVDWMGFNQDALASFFMSIRGRVLELIHRTPSRDYAVTRGQDRGSFNNTLMEQHRNHVHIAMAGGGLVPRVMDSGGILGPREVAANTSGGRELMLPEGMKISLSDDTIRQIVQGFATALNGGGMALVQLGRSR